MAELYEIRIEKLVFGGDGLARLPDGRAVFVPFVLPGELVRVHLTEEKARYVRAYPEVILESSTDRIPPRCPYFTICGGCHYQHLSYHKQLEVKLAILKDQLERIGGISNPPHKGIIPSDAIWNYRNHVQFHITEDGKLGFKDFTGASILPISECHLPQPEIDAVWKQIEFEPGTDIQRIILRQDSFDEVVLLLEGSEEIAPEMTLDLPLSVCYLAPDGNTTTLAGDDAITYQIKDKILTISPESFFQVNTAQAKKMIDYICAALPADKKLEILELYSGVGLFSIFLEPYARHLTAIESSLSACYDFAINMDPFDNISLYEASVEDTLPSLDIKPDVVLMDPPRSGMAKAARDALITLAAPLVIYISCNPATLSRDLKAFLAAGYQLDEIKAFDMFPQTYHVETMTVLRRTQRVTS